jgi:hypothetical protein
MTPGATLSDDFCDAIVLWPNCVSVGSQHAPNDAHSLRRVYRVIWHSTLAAVHEQRRPLRMPSCQMM